MSQAAINHEQLLQRCMGNLQLAERILGRFEVSVSTDIDQLISSINSQSNEEIRQPAHRIKGACANVGAEPLLEIVTELEVLAQSNEIAAPSEWIERIRCEQGRIVAVRNVSS